MSTLELLVYILSLAVCGPFVLFLGQIGGERPSKKEMFHVD